MCGEMKERWHNYYQAMPVNGLVLVILLETFHAKFHRSLRL